MQTKIALLKIFLAFLLISDNHDNPKGKGLHAHCYFTYLTSLTEEDKSFHVRLPRFQLLWLSKPHT